MDKEDGLVQVSISLPKSHVSILPELMKVVATACNSSYSWDSMKLSVSSEVPSDRGSRMIVNLGKRVSSESEVIQGMIHRCSDSVCRHADPSQNLVGEVKMTSFSQRTLKDHLKELAKSDEEEMEGTGWLEKRDVSDEMFYPSWYDQLRMKSVSQMSDGLFPKEKEIPSNSPVVIVNNVNVHHFYESENDEFFPLKCNTKTLTKKVEEVSDETFRLRRVCDRAKNCPETEIFPSRKYNKNVQSPLDIKTKIRELKERLDSTDMCEESYVYVKDSGNRESKERDYSYRQYLCYDEDLPPYPLCDTDESSLNERRIDDLQRESYQKNHGFQLTFKRQSQENMHNRSRPRTKERDEDALFMLSKTVKKTKFHRSFSANAVPQSDGCSREFSPSKRKKEERKRPKSGPEKKVEFIGTSEVDVFSKGDSKKISEVQQQPTNKTSPSRKKTDVKNLIEVQDNHRERKKKRKSHRTSEKMIEDSMPDNHKELSSRNHDERTNEKAHRGDENENKGTKLVISYKSYDEDLDESKLNQRKHDQEEYRSEIKHHRKSKKITEEKTVRSDLDPRVTKHEEKNDGRKSRGKDDTRKIKRPKSERDDNHKTKNSNLLELDFDKSQNAIHEHKYEKQNPESTKSWKRGFLSKRVTTPTKIKEVTHPTTEDHVSIELDEKTSKRALSFLEIISVMADEVKQLGKRRDQKRIRDKVS